MTLSTCWSLAMEERWLAGLANMQIMSRIALISSITMQFKRNRTSRTIGSYTYFLDQVLGRGSFSVVHRGQDQLGQPVAVKLVDLKPLDQYKRNMLLSQIDIISKVEHPNILGCLDVFCEQESCFIVTEICETDLATSLKRRCKLGNEEALNLFRQLLEGYLYLRSLKILHRDLKPANIFLRGGVPKIADFGFAKYTNAQFEEESFNIGTPLYMSPQAFDNNIYSQKSQVWALGVILYQLVHGRTPWKAQSQEELALEIRNSQPFICQWVSPGLSQLIRKCMQVEREQRVEAKELQKQVLLQCQQINNSNRLFLNFLQKVQLLAHQGQLKVSLQKARTQGSLLAQHHFQDKLIADIKTQILKLHAEINWDSSQCGQQIRDQLVLLDYLITLNQLMKLFQRSPWQLSNVGLQGIVNGKVAALEPIHIKFIKQRLHRVGLI